MSKEQIYKKALLDIASASDQANPSHLKTVAQIALDSEPTTADEYNNLGDDIEYRFEKEQVEISEYDKKLSEEAESAWRGTVLHPDYKSPFDEEE
tara:strand:+ start:653 stop:937 length:285 start_codon:yes stop_codon:yes gene_type:complete